MGFFVVVHYVHPADWSENFQGFVPRFPILPESTGLQTLGFLHFYDNILSALLSLTPGSFFNLFPRLS